MKVVSFVVVVNALVFDAVVVASAVVAAVVVVIVGLLLIEQKFLCKTRTLINQFGTRPSNQLNVSISRVIAFRQKGGNALPGMSTRPSNQRPLNISSRC